VQHHSHNYLHDVTTSSGKTIRVTSSHHQRAYIQGLGEDTAQLLAWAEHLSPYSFGEDDNDVMDEEKECEVVWWPKIKALAIQSHPEWSFPCREDWEREYVEYCQSLVMEYLE